VTRTARPRWVRGGAGRFIQGQGCMTAARATKEGGRGACVQASAYVLEGTAEGGAGAVSCASRSGDKTAPAPPSSGRDAAPRQGPEARPPRRRPKGRAARRSDAAPKPTAHASASHPPHTHAAACPPASPSERSCPPPKKTPTCSRSGGSAFSDSTRSRQRGESPAMLPSAHTAWRVVQALM
jgi:hypothetical protein